MTNSEKTSTTNNLSQHKYLKLKRQLQHDTENTPIATRDTEFQTHDQSLRSETAHDRRQKCVSNPASYSLQHQYKLVSDWESQWHSLYHHFTTYHQHRYPSSYQSSRRATSHLSRGSELPKLLTSTRLSPQVPANQQNTALCNLQHPHNSASSGSGVSSKEDPLCYDQSVDSTPDNCDSCNDKYELQYLPMTSFLTSTVYMSSSNRAASTTNADTIKISWYNEYLRATLQQMHAKTRNERKKTKSAPGGCISMLTKQRPELFTSTTITYFSQR